MTVTVRVRAGLTTVEVVDHGPGSADASRRGYGLLGIAERVERRDWLIVNSGQRAIHAACMQTGDQDHLPPWDRRRIMCYRGRVAVLISVDVFRRLMGYLKPIQALFVFRVVSTRVINAAA